MCGLITMLAAFVLSIIAVPSKYREPEAVLVLSVITWVILMIIIYR